eukprot:s98_g13.t2
MVGVAAMELEDGWHVLSCEELCRLKAGLMLLKANEKGKAVSFWGKILGKESDYYIACAIAASKDMYPAKCFYYAGEDFNFTPLPELTEEVGEAVQGLQLTTPLTGKPTAMLETVEGSESQATLNELQRLALLVQEIDFDTACVPKGAHCLTEAQEVVPNSSFGGLEAAKATSLANYVHFRPPASVVSLKAQASNDLEYHGNFLEPLDTDLPKGSWAVRQDPATSSVTLRSLLCLRKSHPYREKTSYGLATPRFICPAPESSEGSTLAMPPRTTIWPSSSEAELGRKLKLKAAPRTIQDSPAWLERGEVRLKRAMRQATRRATWRQLLLLVWIAQLSLCLVPMGRGGRVARTVVAAGPSADQSSILEYLKAAGCLVPTLQIAKEQQEPKASGIREDSGGVHLKTDNMTAKILDYLRSAGTWRSALAIAKAVVGSTATVKDVNPLIYRLEKQGGIKLKKEDGEKPGWQLADFQDEVRQDSADTFGLSEEFLDQVCKALDGQNEFGELAMTLKPDESPELQDVLDEACRKANDCLAKGTRVAKLDPIGSAARLKENDTEYPIYPADWRRFAEQLNRSLGPTMNVSVKDIAIEIHGPNLPVVQIVPESGDFEFDKVPFSNLVKGRFEGLGRDELHAKLKNFFFDNYTGAKDAARIAKALFIPAVADLQKQPWSLILTHMLYREANRGKFKGVKSNFHGVDLFRKLITDLSSWPASSRDSSVAMVGRWASNADQGVKEVVEIALNRWAEIARKIPQKRTWPTAMALVLVMFGVSVAFLAKSKGHLRCLLNFARQEFAIQAVSS